LPSTLGWQKKKITAENQEVKKKSGVARFFGQLSFILMLPGRFQTKSRVLLYFRRNQDVVSIPK
jgi:hypothetical protein